MTEQQARQKIVALANSYLGIAEENGLAPEFVAEAYNECISEYALTATKELPRKSKFYRSYEWCAAFATAIQYKGGLGAAGVYEMSCGKMVTIAKARGIWLENEALYGSAEYPARVGDLVIYSWNDSKTEYKNTDCKTDTSHVGIISAVYPDYMLITEGNYKNMVKQRKIEYNALYVRGFILLDYSGMATETEEKEPEKEPEKDHAASCENHVEIMALQYGARGNAVKAMQALINLWRDNGAALLEIDGKFGPLTREAVYDIQEQFGIFPDGVCGSATWNKLLKGG